MNPPVETERPLLRPLVEDDRVELERLFGDPAVRGGRHVPPERIARIADGRLRQWRVNGFGPWAAIEKASGAWIGRIGLDKLEDVDADARCAEIDRARTREMT